MISQFVLCCTADSVTTSCSCDDGLLQSNVILGIIIWLLLLTIIVIVQLVVLILVTVRRTDSHMTRTKTPPPLRHNGYY